MDMKKYIYMICMLIMVFMLFIMMSCGKTDDSITIKSSDGNEITIKTDGFSEDQIQALKDVRDGTQDLETVIRSGLFTFKQMQEMGLMSADSMNRAGGPMGQGGGFPEMDISGIDINDLDLEGLSEEQIQAVKDVLGGKRTLQSLIDDSVLTMEEFRGIGFFPDRGGRQPMPSDETLPEGT
jgi:hypothetical protein